MEETVSFAEFFERENVYKHINPKKHLKDCILQGIRPQNRQFLDYRSCILDVSFLSKCLSSSIVKIGNTTVMCGIRGKFRKPNKKTPSSGFVQISTKIPEISYPNISQKDLQQSTKLCTSFLNRVFLGMNIIDPKELCVSEGELVWILHIDVVCLNYDGALYDAAITGIYTALKSLRLSQLNFDLEKKKFVLNESIKKPLNIQDCPISLTFGIFEGVILADPAVREEQYCTSLFSILIRNDNLCFIQKQGGHPLTDEQMKGCIDLAKKRAVIVKTAIEEVIKNSTKSKKKF